MPSICTGQFVRIGGIEQWIAARGDCTSNPGLFVIGGPGVALSRMAPFFAPWERRFTLIHWDQPGAGATAREGAHDSRLTIARLADDAAGAIEWARDALGIERIAVLGYSGGSVVGLHLARQRPHLFCAYIGVGQFVDWSRQEALSYEMVLREARLNVDEAAIEELERLGPPPYPNAAADAVKSRYATAMTSAEKAEFARLDESTAGALRIPPPAACYLAPDGSPQDPRALALAAYEKLRTDLVGFNAAQFGREFGVAMFFFQGDQDLYAVSSEVERYAASIQAPVVRYATIDGGGHSALFLRHELGALLNQHVRPLFP